MCALSFQSLLYLSAYTVEIRKSIGSNLTRVAIRFSIEFDGGVNLRSPQTLNHHSLSYPPCASL
jgi:hypothetical protein